MFQLLIYLTFRLKKSAEHRKNVLQRKIALEERQAAVPFKDIVNDTSVGKTRSHHQLLTYITKYGDNSFLKYFKKEELLKLCNAYGITAVSMSSKKAVIGQQLIPTMKESQCIPCPYFLDNLTSSVNIDSGNRRVSITISRGLSQQ